MLASVPHVAPGGYCSSYPLAPPTKKLSPVLTIASGYRGVGGIGSLDGYGCVAGRQAAGTRVLLPRADFVVLVLARARCRSGDEITGSLDGLGLDVASVPMRCTKDLYARVGLPNHRAYVSGIYDVTGTGTIAGRAALGEKSYATSSRKIV